MSEGGGAIAQSVSAGWESVATLPALGEHELQVWRIELTDENTPVEDYLALLSAEECARAARLRAGQVRLQYVVARSRLRILLGNYLGLDPAKVTIEASSYGKPETPDVYYNVAHSGATVLIALCRKGSLGVDIEYFNREVEALEIAKNSFAESEYRELAAISDPEQLRRAFFRCWTRKEAVIKADGRGLSLPLTSFMVPVAQAAHATRVEMSDGTLPGGSIFYVTDLLLGDKVAAAFAVSSAECTTRRLNFPAL